MDATGGTSWYRRAVFYEILVQGFNDVDGDGTGDLAGISEKLDYLQWLGVDCLCLLPFYKSPLRDGGYDISDYFSILVQYGDVGDAVELLEQAHLRGIRVIADLVMNHTSDQHPWFQESRRDSTNAKATWYVWTDDDQQWPDVPILCVGNEPSNWTWDPERQQYYWHRFFSHEPDLNYGNPEVQQIMLDVVRFWFDVGLDGFRLDAVAYLFEREGTDGENLPETHQYLKRLRKEVDATHPGKVLLANVNQWPSEVVDYFGAGDECHMCFHPPLMARMFMAIRQEQRHPLVEILHETPEIPGASQWAISLRNQEPSLEVLSNEEHDSTHAEHAEDPGIGRRLASLVDNDRRVIELFHGLLFSMPGSPILYYGDEIGMGDNMSLGERDGARTPMQWTPDRNAGFSRADAEEIYLPVVLDPMYSYQAVNVEAQIRNESSLLHWMQRALQVRRSRADMFGMGTFRVIHTENPSVLVFVRQLNHDTVLCVNNFSRFPQPVEMLLSEFQGATPVEMSGRVPCPSIGRDPYLLMLGPRAFYWFDLEGAPISEPS